MTDSSKRPSGASSRTSSGRRPSSSPTGTSRAGRREVPRRRYDQASALERFRTPIVVLVVAAIVVGVSAFVFIQSSQPVYACTTVDTVKPAADGQLGQIQSDMGNAHVNAGDEVTYPVCPPASGKHVNRTGYGPLSPDVYGPDDNSVPNGWVHNLEHGGLVLLYSCEKGACDEASLRQLQGVSAGFPTSTVCQIPPGVVGPVIARFEQMPTKYAALVWNRALYLDELDTQAIYDFFSRYAEVVSADGQWISPPEPQCTPPSPSPDASPSGSPEASPAASPRASAEASPATSSAPVEPGTSASPASS